LSNFVDELKELNIMAFLNRLNQDQKKEFTNLVKEGTTPADLAKHFNLAISTVHNYKKELKSEGIEMPNVRGQRPSGHIVKGAGVIPHDGALHNHNHFEVIEDGKTDLDSEELHLTINGIHINIGGHPKTVNINNGRIEVEF
jgi:hypothetical protein